LSSILRNRTTDLKNGRGSSSFAFGWTTTQRKNDILITVTGFNNEVEYDEGTEAITSSSTSAGLLLNQYAEFRVSAIFWRYV
jgi:hypothetical protein